MTLKELDASLPNGFHDSEIQSILLNYVRATATLELSIWVGQLDAPPEKREAYKEATLTVSGIQFATIGPPLADFRTSKAKAITVDYSEDTAALDQAMLARLPQASFVGRFFVFDWNAFIYLAGMNAEILWKDNGSITYR